MTDYLVDHAISNVWCTPAQDGQIIIKPARLTPKGGVFNSWRVLFTTLYMPLKNVRFHLFQIGQIHPYIVSLFPKVEEWTTIAQSCMLNKTICDIYTDTGIELPRCETWYIVTEERNVIVAIKENSNIPIDFDAAPFYFRVYNNEYFSSSRSADLDDYIYINGGTMVDTDAILALQTIYNQKKLLPGGICVLKNGYKIKDLSLVTVSVNDTVEFIYDSSIIKIIDFPISSLNTFDSTMDSQGKYLLHYSGGIGNTIDYQDDIDLFILDGTTEKGIYFHKNAGISTLRMITHRDYSIPVSLVTAFMDSHVSQIDSTNAKIRLHIRKSGYLRPLVNEHHRIKELYKLSDENIQMAMLGVDSTVDVWMADSLEQSKYNQIMQSSHNQITNSLVKDAYGYNAVVKITAETPVKTVLFNSQRIAVMPYLLQVNSAVYEYDTDGLLLGYYLHSSGEIYNCANQNCAYVEATLGEFSDTPDEYYNVESVQLDSNYDYRFYSTPRDNTNLNKIWEDVTGGSQYVVINGVATWLTGNLYDTLVRSNKKSLVRTMNIIPTDGLLAFNFISGQEVLKVPMGELSIFLNKRSLIENLDYVIKFPNVVITNKEFLISPYTTPQEITYRYTGLCNTDLTQTDIAEFGFVRNGRLSVDHQYDIRDDKVIRISINGGLKTRDDLFFNEDTNTYELLDVLNGKPYLIKDTIVPVKSIVHVDTLEYKQLSRVVDSQISDYLTVKLSQPEPPTLNPIADYYKLYSPFICKILFDVINNVIDNLQLTVQYNDDQIRNIAQPYVYLLDFDPIDPDHAVNSEYVIIHPHHLNEVINLTIYQYTFMNRLVNLYASGKINFSTHARIV